MKTYLIDFFKYNDWAFRTMLASAKELPEPDEAVKLFSHLITSHNKWYNRLKKEVDDTSLAWFGPIFRLDELETKWHESLNRWLKFIEDSDQSVWENEIVFQRPADSKKYGVKLQDVLLQLNYHSIHHRAQIGRIIRQQGLTPPQTDYIITVLRPK